MDWMCGSNSRVPALQAQSPELNPSPTKKKTRKKVITRLQPYYNIDFVQHNGVSPLRSNGREKDFFQLLTSACVGMCALVSPQEVSLCWKRLFLE
jgi:hypothetical protein